MRKSPLLHSIKTAVGRRRWFRRGSRTLVAVSGGADSVALLHALHELAPALGIRLIVAHLHHGIRGAAADADAEFVAELAGRLRLPLVTERVNVPRRAKASGQSIEMAARAARYAFLAGAARKAQADVVATAHTADDQAETLVLKLARGTGIKGLAGIPRQTVLHGIPVVRPLLNVPRREILAFLKERRLPWREDESNLDVTMLRNRVRHEVLPFLEAKLNPRIRQALNRLADVASQEDEWMDAVCASILPACSLEPGALSVNLLLRQPLAVRRRVLRLWLAARGVPAEAIAFDDAERIEALVRSPRGSGAVTLPGNERIKRSYDRLTLESGCRPATTAAVPRRRIAVPGKTALPSAGLRVVAEIAPGVARDRDAKIGRFPAGASLALTALGSRKLYIRSRRDGDRIQPFGLHGSKKLQDIFVNAKVPADQRMRIPVFECGGEIVWLPGYRIARGWEVQSPTERALQLRVERSPKATCSKGDTD